MKKHLVHFSLLLLSVTFISSCGGDKLDATVSETSTVSGESATQSETPKIEDSSTNEKSTSEKIKEKATETEDKIVEKVNEGKEASRPLLNRMKGKLKEKMESKQSN
jgi:hypothetical protein